MVNKKMSNMVRAKQGACTTEKDCKSIIQPVRDSLDILNGKWKLPIIIALSFGNKRFKEIRQEIPGITDRMLAKELRDLEINDLIRRTVYDSHPVYIEYSMTDYGRTLNQVIDALRDWGMQHRKRLFSRRH